MKNFMKIVIEISRVHETNIGSLDIFQTYSLGFICSKRIEKSSMPKKHIVYQN